MKMEWKQKKNSFYMSHEWKYTDRAGCWEIECIQSFGEWNLSVLFECEIEKQTQTVATSN